MQRREAQPLQWTEGTIEEQCTPLALSLRLEVHMAAREQATRRGDKGLAGSLPESP